MRSEKNGNAIHYEVHALTHGRWQMAARHPAGGRDAAIDQAKALHRDLQVSAVKVVQEIHNPADNSFVDVNIYYNARKRPDIGRTESPGGGSVGGGSVGELDAELSEAGQNGTGRDGAAEGGVAMHAAEEAGSGEGGGTTLRLVLSALAGSAIGAGIGFAVPEIASAAGYADLVPRDWITAAAGAGIGLITAIGIVAMGRSVSDVEDSDATAALAALDGATSETLASRRGAESSDYDLDLLDELLPPGAPPPELGLGRDVLTASRGDRSLAEAEIQGALSGIAADLDFIRVLEDDHGRDRSGEADEGTIEADMPWAVGAAGAAKAAASARPAASVPMGVSAAAFQVAPDDAAVLKAARVDVMAFLSESLTYALRTSPHPKDGRLDAFGLSGCSLFIAGAAAAYCRLKPLPDRLVQPLIEASCGAFDRNPDAGRQLAAHYAEYLLNPRSRAIFEAGADAIGKYLSGATDGIGRYLVWALDAWYRRPQSGDAPVGVLVTDLPGLAAVRHSQGPEQADHLVAIHDAILADALRQYRGREIRRTGSGLVAAFDSAAHAAPAAIAVMRAAHEYVRSYPSVMLHLRIGIHVGPAPIRPGDPDEGRSGGGQSVRGRGATVQHAVALCALAPADAIYVSDSVRNAGGVAASAFIDQGSHMVEGFRNPMPVAMLPWFSA